MVTNIDNPCHARSHSEYGTAPKSAFDCGIVFESVVKILCICCGSAFERCAESKTRAASRKTFYVLGGQGWVGMMSTGRISNTSSHTII